MPGKKRVLHIVVGSMPAGGIETFIMNVFRNIDRDKISFEFLYTTMDSSFYDGEIRRLGGVIHRFPGIGIKHPIHTRRILSEFYNENSFDCVHLHQGIMHYTLPFKLAKKCRVPKRVIHAHNVRRKPHGVMGWYAYMAHRLNRRLCLATATDCFACSQLAAEWFGFTEFCQNGWKLINNGIDLGRFKFNEKIRKEVREELGGGVFRNPLFLLAQLGGSQRRKTNHFCWM